MIKKKKKNHCYCFSLTSIRIQIQDSSSLFMSYQNGCPTLFQKANVSQKLTAYFYRCLSFTLKFLISKRINFHQHKRRYLPVFQSPFVVTVHLPFLIYYTVKTDHFLIHLKSQFKSNACTLQREQCLLLLAPSREKIIVGHSKKMAQ